MTVQAIGDLLSQPFLDLQATGESLNYASELGQARDALRGKIADMSHAVKRQHVVLAKGRREYFSAQATRLGRWQRN
jgi:hypothetical protein